MKIEGIPDGWELVRIVDSPQIGEYAIDRAHHVVMVTEPEAWDLAVIVRKIERPKSYRPFANAEEFKPPPKRTIQKLIQAVKPFLSDDLEGTWAIHKLQETLEDAIEDAEKALEEME